jgi:hypothetical protein
MDERVEDEAKSERRIVMTRIGDEMIALRRKPADLPLVTIAREPKELLSRRQSK